MFHVVLRVRLVKVRCLNEYYGSEIIHSGNSHVSTLKMNGLLYNKGKTIKVIKENKKIQLE